MNNIFLKQVGFAILVLVGLFTGVLAYRCPFKEDLEGTNCRCIESQGNLICENFKIGLDFTDYGKWPIQLNSIIIRNSNNIILKLVNTKSTKLILENNSEFTLDDNILLNTSVNIVNLQVLNTSLTLDKIMIHDQITDLVFEENQIDIIPNINMTNLKYLSLKNNKIKILNNNFVTQFPALTYLNLENNIIDSIAPDSLNFPTNEIEINLSHNDITDAVFNKTNLKETLNIKLDLSYNKIVDFLNNTFMKYSTSSSKIIINLNYNPIKCNYKNNSWIFISSVHNSIKKRINHVYCENNVNLLEMSEYDLDGHPTPKTDEPPTLTTPGIKTDLPPVDTTPVVKTDIPPIISTSPNPKTDVPPVVTTPQSKTDVPPVVSSPNPRTDIPPINDQRTDLPPINGQTDIPPTITTLTVVTSPNPKTDIPPINDQRTDIPPIDDHRNDIPPIDDHRNDIPPIDDHRNDIPPKFKIINPYI